MYCCRADIIYPITTKYYFYKSENLLSDRNKYIYDARWEKIFKLKLKERKNIYRTHHICKKHINEINNAIKRQKGKESARQYRIQKTERKKRDKMRSQIINKIINNIILQTSETIIIVPEPDPIYLNYSEQSDLVLE